MFDTPTGRRLMIFKVSSSLLVDMLSAGNIIAAEVLDGIPRDGKVVGIYVDQQLVDPIVCLKIESAEFRELPDGAVIPTKVAVLNKLSYLPLQ